MWTGRFMHCGSELSAALSASRQVYGRGCLRYPTAYPSTQSSLDASKKLKLRSVLVSFPMIQCGHITSSIAFNPVEQAHVPRAASSFCSIALLPIIVKMKDTTRQRRWRDQIDVSTLKESPEKRSSQRATSFQNLLKLLCVIIGCRAVRRHPI